MTTDIFIAPKYAPWNYNGELRWKDDRAAARYAYRNGASHVVRVKHGEIGEQSDHWSNR